MLSLTHVLTRDQVVPGLGVSTTSRGVDGLVSHSRLYSTQNSTQPIGARAARADGDVERPLAAA